MTHNCRFWLSWNPEKNIGNLVAFPGAVSNNAWPSLDRYYWLDLVLEVIGHSFKAPNVGCGSRKCSPVVGQVVFPVMLLCYHPRVGNVTTDTAYWAGRGRNCYIQTSELSWREGVRWTTSIVNRRAAFSRFWYFQLQSYVFWSVIVIAIVCRVEGPKFFVLIFYISYQQWFKIELLHSKP